MRLITFEGAGGGPRAGAWIDDDTRIVDLGESDAALSTLQGLIEGGSDALDAARAAVAAPRVVVPAAEVTVLAPLQQPVQMRDFLCFETHLKQSFRAAMELQASFAGDPAAALEELKASGRFDIPDVWYELPIYYKCNRFSVIGPDRNVRWPGFSQLMDYELELACIIGEGGADIAEDEASRHIFGFTIFNDMTARDAQTREMQGMLGPAKGKDFDTGNVLGPCIVTADEIGNAYDLDMRARVNGEEWSRGNSGTIYHSFEKMIAHVSQSETIHPGEVFGSGTVGNGCGLELKRFLQPGDTVELEIEKIGKLANKLVQW